MTDDSECPGGKRSGASSPGNETAYPYLRDERGRFVLGTSPGPGRPRGREDFTRRIVRQILAEIGGDAEPQRVAYSVAGSLLHDAMRGRIGAVRALLDVLEDRPPRGRKRAQEAPEGDGHPVGPTPPADGAAYARACADAAREALVANLDPVTRAEAERLLA